jgi:hypothetical protein
VRAGVGVLTAEIGSAFVFIYHTLYIILFNNIRTIYTLTIFLSVSIIYTTPTELYILSNLTLTQQL